MFYVGFGFDRYVWFHLSVCTLTSFLILEIEQLGIKLAGMHTLNLDYFY